MIPRGFVLAMQGCRQQGRAGTTWRVASTGSCWLVLCRWGTDGEFLSVGLAGAHALAPCATLLGLLGPPPPAAGAAAFLLQSRLPSGMALAGCFLPASGVAWLERRRGALRLSLLGRGAGTGCWRIDAARVPWIGEAIDPA